MCCSLTSLKNKTSKTTAVFGAGIVKDKSKTVDEETKRKFEEDNKTVRGISGLLTTNQSCNRFTFTRTYVLKS